MVSYQFQQARNEEFQSRKKIEEKQQAAGYRMQWSSSRRSEFRYAQFFAIIEKVIVHSENKKFRYAQIFAKLEKFR